MAAFSEYLASGILNYYFRGSGDAITIPPNISIALTSGVCTGYEDGSTIPEIASGINGSGTGYARKDINDPPSEQTGYWVYEGSGVMSNVSNIVFNSALLDWGTVSGIAIVDSSTYGQGNLLFHGAVSKPRDVYTGDNVKFDPNTLEISLE